MKLIRKIFILTVLFFLGLTFIYADTQVSISSSASLATIGDKINLKIIVATTEEIQEFRIKTEKNDFDLLVHKDLPASQKQEYTVFEKNLLVTFFKTGDYNIGPFEVELIKDNKLLETRKTNSIPITIKSVLTEEDKDIKELKNPIQIKGNPFYILKYLFIILGIALIVVLIILYIKKRKKKPIIAEPPLLSPIEEFDLKIKELTAQNLFEKGNIIEFFIKLTKITKHFLHREHLFQAEDYTTYETLKALKQKEKEILIQNNMEFLFDISDLAKFAKFIPDSRTPDEIFRKIDEMIFAYKKRTEIKDNQE
jgi:hypothetical protein